MTFLGNKFSQLREDLGFTVDEFAQILGIHRSSIYRYEGTNKAEARDMPIDLAIKIADMYDISLDWLAGKSDIKFRNQTPNKLTEIYTGLNEDNKKELFNFAMYLKNKEVK